MNRAARSIMSLVLLGMSTQAMAERYQGEGRGVDSDITRACEKALETARETAAGKAEQFIQTVDSLQVTSDGDETESSFSRNWRSTVLASTRLDTIEERSPVLSKDGTYVTCDVKASFEVNTDAAMAQARAAAARMEKYATTDRLIAQYQLELAQNQKAFQEKQLRLASLVSSPKKGSVSVACDADDLPLCRHEIISNLTVRERRQLAAELAVNESLLSVAVIPGEGSPQRKAINDTQQTLTWTGTYAVNATLADPYAARNAELENKVAEAKAAYAPVTRTVLPSTFQSAADRISLLALLVWECADCDENEFEPLQPSDANIGGKGLVVRAVYDNWIGISSGWFREGIVYCSRTDIAYPGAPEACSAGDSTSGDMIGVGPYVAWRILSVEAMRMTHASDMRVFGVNVTEPYWRFNVSLNFVPRDSGLTAALGYSRRDMPDLPGQLVRWKETSDLSLQLGYKF